MKFEPNDIVIPIDGVRGIYNYDNCLVVLALASSEHFNTFLARSKHISSEQSSLHVRTKTPHAIVSHFGGYRNNDASRKQFLSLMHDGVNK